MGVGASPLQAGLLSFLRLAQVDCLWSSCGTPLINPAQGVGCEQSSQITISILFYQEPWRELKGDKGDKRGREGVASYRHRVRGRGREASS